MQIEDGNTQALNDHLDYMDALEKQWEESLPQKQEEVIAYAIKIMEGLVSNEEFVWVFCEYYVDSDFDNEVYVRGFEEALDNWNKGITPETEIEREMLCGICLTALDGASHTLFDIEFSELFANENKAMWEVMGNDN